MLLYQRSMDVTLRKSLTSSNYYQGIKIFLPLFFSTPHRTFHATLPCCLNYDEVQDEVVENIGRELIFYEKRQSMNR